MTHASAPSSEDAWPQPLAGIDTSAPLPTTKNADGKSLASLPQTDCSPSSSSSSAYHTFHKPIEMTNNAFDFHIYIQPDEAEIRHAYALHERIRREFPELRVYRVFEQPIGPHPVGQFEVNVFTPHQFGALFGFLVAFRGPLSVLIHPNAGDSVRDHTERASWMGAPWPINVEALKRFERVGGVLQNQSSGAHD